MNGDRDKEIEALARFLCRAAKMEPSALVVEGPILGPLKLNGCDIAVLTDPVFPAWQCFADTARQVLEAGWTLPDGVEPDMESASKPVEATEDPARPRTPEERWRDEQGLR